MALQDSFRQASHGSRYQEQRQRQRDLRRKLARKVLLETLEGRQLMAVGPQLVGIEPNNGTLLQNNAVLTQVPSELTLRFSDTQPLDASTLSAIRITRAGADGFSAARAITDFNTQGQVQIEFTGKSSSETRINLLAANLSSVSAAPSVSLSGNQVNITLNTNNAAPTRVQDLLNTINNGVASSLVNATLVQGVNFARLDQNIPATGLGFTLVAADRAQVTSNLGASNVSVRFAARATGQAGQGISISVLLDTNVGTAPNIAVNGSSITVRINPTANVTVNQFIQALQARPTVDELLEIRLESGNGSSLLGNPGLYSPISLSSSSPGAQADDVITPGFVGLGDLPGEVVIRFAEMLPQDTYRLEISGEGSSALRNVAGDALNNGQDFAITFSVNRAPTVQAVVPQPIVNDPTLGRRQLTNEVWVYFDRNDAMDTASVQNPALYRIFSSNGGEFAATSVTYNATSGVARLVFANGVLTNTDSWRLRVGGQVVTPGAPTSIVLPVETAANAATSPGDAIATALNVTSQWGPSTTQTRSVRITSEIRNNSFDANNPTSGNIYTVDFPGGSDEAGNRQIRAEDPTRLDTPVPLDHLRQGADSVNGISSIQYNFFGSFLGDDPTTREFDLSKTYTNLITETQKQRVREVLDLYSQYLGVQFIETASAGIQIAVGDLYGGDVTATSGVGGLPVVTGVDPRVTTDRVPRPLGVMDFQDFSQSDDDQLGGEFFRGAMLVVGQLLGFGYADELTGSLNSGTSVFTAIQDALFPAPADIIHGQYLYRPDSVDIDMYRFDVPLGGGRVTIETVAERLSDASSLNTQLRLFRQNATGAVEEVAANDDFWSADSQIDLTLAAGTYFIGVSASGNSNYNPSTTGTGFGGLSEGQYELRMSFTPTQQLTIKDSTGLALDGDADGTPGGAYDFWFDTTTAARTVYVDKGAAIGGNGTLASPFNTISAAIARANTGNVDIIRILANGGTDGRIETQADNLAYQIGFSESGSALPDGTDLQVPRGVTVMVDAGSIIKLRRARIGVGSSSPSLNQSGGAFQVLGTPLLVTSDGARIPGNAVTGEVVLTALADKTAGGTQTVNSPRSGDWGGIDFRSDIDKADENRENQEARGIFLNTVQWADIRYGGGTVLVAGQPTAVSPIELSNARPLIAYSTISLAADSAIEATPDSFEETKYARQVGQAVEDYSRVGPDIRGNRFVNEELATALGITNAATLNSINGVFVRTATRDGTGLEELTIQARFNDRDIVYVLGENLKLRGTPGGAVADEQSPPTLLVKLTGTTNGSLAAGTYQYKITFVDAAGNESPASDATLPVTLNATGGVQLSQLPTVPAQSQFVARRIYRSGVIDVGGVTYRTEYGLVGSVNGFATVFDDTTAVAGRGLPGAVSLSSATLAAGANGNVAPGTYAYKLTFVRNGGAESAVSSVSNSVTVNATGSVQLNNLPTARAENSEVARRLYRAAVITQNGQTFYSDFGLIADLDAATSSYVDTAANSAQLLTLSPRLRARLDARLMIDPGMVVKSSGSLLELGLGTQLIAEGTAGRSIIMTSLDDNRFGAGATFATNKASSTQGFQQGDWGGIYIGAGASASIDNARIIGAGGAVRAEGDLIGVNAVEVHQGKLRLTNSRVEESANGANGLGGDRFGRGAQSPGAVFARGSQPVIAGNIFIGNDAPALNFDVNSLNYVYVNDTGRSTGALGRVVDAPENQGPLVRGNVLQDNNTNGMLVRGGVLTTEGVWDDADIVHVVRETIEIPNQHVYGGLRLESSPRQSLVVKFLDTSDANGIVSAAGIVVGGTLTSASAQLQDIDDRIGGSLQIVGQPSKPVVLTSLADDSIGAGFNLLGEAVTDTNNDGFGGESVLPTIGEVNNGLLIDNDVDINTPGYFAVEPGNAGNLGAGLGANNRGGVTAQGLTQLFIDQNFVFAYTNFVDVGPLGGAFNLAGTTITTPATLVSDDLVVSEGNFQGVNGTINWRIETSLGDGLTRVDNVLTLTSNQPIGALRFINYLDEDVQAVDDDLLFTTGVPGQDNFRVFTLDGPERIGFAQGGSLTPGPNLQNATYVGWTADAFPDLNLAIQAAAPVAFSVNGVIDLVDLPAFNDPTLGAVNGPADVTTAFAWDAAPAATTVRIGTFLELVPNDPTVIESGEWQGITIREAASDSNYRMVVEGEGGGIGSGSRNDEVNFAQFVGEIAPSAQFATENRPLGFRVSGVLGSAADVDVYSFKAEAGTEVWLDIDRSYAGLDAVLELVDVNGNTLVRSDNSIDEERDPSKLTTSNGFESAKAHSLRKSSIANDPRSAFDQPQDLHSTNVKDPGFRAVLPGEAGQVNTYRVRVRSTGGTSGAYQLDIRNGEADLTPGTLLNLADIRYARTGVNVIGQPLHSPLIGDEAEQTAANDTIATAQRLGNFGVANDSGQTANLGPLGSDRLSKSIAGTLSGQGDVDWYQFDVNYNNLTRDSLRKYFSAIFDADYADGFARPDISLWIFDSNGNLILGGLDSNIADDQPNQSGSTGQQNLSGGSAGTLDPYVGSIELSEGTYFLAVSGRDTVPADYNQFFVANASNTLFRLEPVESVQRIVEDRIGDPTTATTAPKQGLLFNTSSMETPYTLNDVALYINQGTTGGSRNNLHLVNPFTGQNYGVVGNINVPAEDARDILDIAFNPTTGRLYGYINNGTDGSVDYYEIDSGTAATTLAGSSGIETRNDFVIEAPFNILDQISNDGFTVNAMTIESGRGFAVGNRDRLLPGLNYATNILVGFEPNTGQFQGSRPNQIFTASAGAGFVPREFGQIETVPPVTQRRSNVLGTSDATTLGPDGISVPTIANGDSFAIVDSNNNSLATFVFNSGPEIRFNSLLVASGQTKAANNGTLIELSAGASTVNDAYNGQLIQIGNETRRIIDYFAQTQEAIVDLPFSGNAPAGTNYLIVNDRFVRDGDLLTVTRSNNTNVVFEYDTGARLRIDTNLTDGSRVTVTGVQGQQATFEFDSNAQFTPGAIAIPLNTNSSPAAALASAISAAGLGVSAFATVNEIVLNRITALPVSTTGITVVGSDGTTGQNVIPIIVDEAMGADEIAAVTQRVLTSQGFTAFVDGSRINITDAAGVVGTGTGFNTIAPTAAGATVVQFNVNSTATEIRDQIIGAINAANLGITATPLDGDSLTIGANFRIISGSGLSQGGTAPVGNGAPTITGTAMINDNLYAVSDAGGLFRITPGELIVPSGNQVFSALNHYVQTATDLVGIEFVGLSRGPSSIVGDLLFGIDADGVLYAFDTSGELQPIFVGGRSSIATGVVGATGLDFSPHEQNLWGVAVDATAGHGSAATFNGSRNGAAGGSVLNFGPYNVPGGAHGEITSEEFSLVGYSSADQPMMYFNYLLDTENSVALNGTDILRVYVVAEDGVEQMVSTNNIGLGSGASDDEFDDPATYGGIYTETYANRPVADAQHQFDGTGWRQARVPLGAFAGQKGLKLRIEFSTSGNLADYGTRLTAVPASEIQDGDQFTISGRTFEFEFNQNLSIPAGAVLGGATYTVKIDGITYALVTDLANTPLPATPDDRVIPVVYATRMDGQTIARLLTQAISASQFESLNRNIDIDTIQATSDQISQAITLPLFGEQTHIVSSVSNIGDPANPAAVDIDMYRLDVFAGQRVEVIVRATTQSLNPALRLFDGLGNIVPATVDNLGSGVMRLTYDALATQAVYLGISGGAGPNALLIPGNTTYDPVTHTGVQAGTSGSYILELNAVRNSNVRSVGDKIAVNQFSTVELPPGSPIQVLGNNGTAGIPVRVNVAMSASEIATAISQALRATFVASPRTSTEIHSADGANVKLQGLVINNLGPLKELARSGDAFGAGVIAGARNNNFGGVRLDDFIIGFAERGEMGFNLSPTPVANPTFQASGRPLLNSPIVNPLQITSGPYQIEIRDGSEYLFTTSYDTRRSLQTTSGIGRAFDTNERLSGGTSLLVASGQLIERLVAGLNVPLTFTLSDSENVVTFQFINLESLPPGSLEQDAGRFVQSGNIAIPYRPIWTASQVAARVLNAFQTPSVRAVLDIRSLMSNGKTLDVDQTDDLSDDAKTELQGDARINLFGDNVIINSNINDLILSYGDLVDRVDRQSISKSALPDVTKPLIGSAELIDALDSVQNATGLNLPGFALAVEVLNGRGDRNRDRSSQGVVMLDGVNVQFSSEYGIALDHGLGSATSPNVVRYPRNLVELNTGNVVPGVVVQNSVLAYNNLGGILVTGVGTDASSAPPVAFDRLINNTIVGGQVTEGVSAAPTSFDGTLFTDGTVAFADAVVSYSPNLANVPPDLAYRTPAAALGVPNYTLQTEPTAAGQGAVSLGRRGQLVVQFIDNRLTGSGDARPDLKVFEVGVTEPVRVEISIDNVNYVFVGNVLGGQNSFDIDRLGFGPSDRISYVRLTDTGFSNDLTAGGDIDAVGAISSVPSDTFVAGGAGIDLANGVSPTILNNVIVNSTTGIRSVGTNTPVIAGNTYQRNTAATSVGLGLGQFAQDIGVLKDLFVSMTSGKFIPNKSADIIDNAIDSLQDRAQLVVVKQPLGLPQSPVLSPDLDGNGTLRVDDPSIDASGGFGASLFKDRGAFDRGDNAPPRATVSAPLDQSAVDLNPEVDRISVVSQTTRFFEIRLADGGEPIDPNGGVGIDDSSINPDIVLLTKDGVPLVRDLDYRFSYDANTDTIRLTPTAGLWDVEAVYRVTLVTDNKAILIGKASSTYNDGDRFQIVDTDGVTTNFEFDTGYVIQILDTGNGRTGLVDGDLITIYDGTVERVYEFDTGNGIAPNNALVTLPLNATIAEAATALAAVIQATGQGVTVVDLLDGRVQVLSANRLVTITSSTTLVNVAGATGVSAGFGIVVPSTNGIADTVNDGQTFTILLGDGRQNIFEFTTDGTVTQGNIPVFITLNSTAVAVANAINTAIRGTQLDLLPTVDPTGIVLLPDAASVSLLLANSTLTQSGRSGDTGSIRIALPLNLTVAEVTSLIETSIDAQALPGVATSVIGDRVIVAGTVSGTGSALVSPPRDLAGNRLVGNAVDGLATFEIQLTTGSDYGDAAGSSRANNGPRHRIIDGLSLGPSVSPEADSREVDQDSFDDGVIQKFTNANNVVERRAFGSISIVAGGVFEYTVNVTNAEATRPVYLDAWIDWDGDGVFEENGVGSAGDEHIEIKSIVSAGDNNFGRLAPPTAKRGTIAARFRLSTTGGLAATGEASDGEVEDYQITIRNSPYQNPSNGLDVTAEGGVSPVDALIVINALNANNGQPIFLDLSATNVSVPPYLDVNGDGIVSPMDVNEIITFLNSQVRQAEPEDVFVQAASGVMAPVSQMARDTTPPENVSEAVLEVYGDILQQVSSANVGGNLLEVYGPQLWNSPMQNQDADEESEDGFDAFFNEFGSP